MEVNTVKRKISVKKIKPAMTSSARQEKSPSDRRSELVLKEIASIARGIERFVNKNESSYLIIRKVTPSGYVVGRKLHTIVYEVNNNNPFHPYEKKTEGEHFAFAYIDFSEITKKTKFEVPIELVTILKAMQGPIYRINKADEIPYILEKIGKI